MKSVVMRRMLAPLVGNSPGAEAARSQALIDTISAADTPNRNGVAIVLKPPVIDPLITYHLENPGVMAIRREMLNRILELERPGVTTESVDAAAKLHLFSQIADKVADIRRDQMRLGLDTAADYSGRRYDLDWTHAHTVRCLAAVDAWLKRAGYKQNNVSVDDHSRLWVWRPKKNVGEHLPVIAICGMKNKDILFDLYVNNSKLMVWDYGGVGQRDNNTPPSMTKDDFDGTFPVTEAQRFRDGCDLALPAIKQAVQEAHRNAASKVMPGAVSTETVKGKRVRVRRMKNLSHVAQGLDIAAVPVTYEQHVEQQERVHSHNREMMHRHPAGHPKHETALKVEKTVKRHLDRLKGPRGKQYFKRYIRRSSSIHPKQA